MSVGRNYDDRSSGPKLGRRATPGLRHEERASSQETGRMGDGRLGARQSSIESPLIFAVEGGEIGHSWGLEGGLGAP